MFEALKNAAIETGFKKKAAIKSGMPVVLKKNVPAGKIETTIGTVADDEAPRLWIFIKEGAFDIAVVSGDKNLIELQADNISMAIIMFIGVHYVFEIGYAKTYSQFLGFLQRAFLQEVYTHLKSPGHIEFLAKFDDEVSKIEEARGFKKLCV